MMNKTIVIFLFFLIIFSLSCKKKSNNVISGQLTDMSSGLVVADATVNLYYNDVSSGSYNPNFKFLSSTKTDSNGNYKIEFESKMYSKLRLSCNKESYHNRNIEFFAEDIATNYTKNIKIGLESYLKVHVWSCYTEDSNARMFLKITGINSDCDICCSSASHRYDGNNVNDLFTCAVIGGDTVTVETINGIYSESKKIACPIKDTAYFNCWY